jgi:small subunit ribosomal protein S8
MSMTDPIADLLAQIRNAILAKKDRLSLPASKVKLEVCRILQEEGYIRGFGLAEGKPSNSIQILLRYDESGVPAISHMTRVSRPGRRVYRGADDLEPVRNGLGTGIVSTSQGLLSDRTARERRVGGEVLCEIW